MRLSCATATTVCPCTSGLSTVLSAVGSLTETPCCSSGATSIMMMSSTSMTSTSGVTLISDLTPPCAPPRSIAIQKSPNAIGSKRDRVHCRRSSRRKYATPNPGLRRLPDEVVDELRRRIVHFHVEVFDAAGQVIVEPHGRNRDDESERGFH